MEYVLRHAQLMESEIEQGEEILTKLVQRLTDMGLGDSISAWLEVGGWVWSLILSSSQKVVGFGV